MLLFLQLTQQPVFHAGRCSFAVAWLLFLQLTQQTVFHTEVVLIAVAYYVGIVDTLAPVLLSEMHVGVVDTLAPVLLSEVLSWPCHWLVVWPLFVPLFSWHCGLFLSLSLSLVFFEASALSALGLI